MLLTDCCAHSRRAVLAIPRENQQKLSG